MLPFLSCIIFRVIPLGAVDEIIIDDLYVNEINARVLATKRADVILKRFMRNYVIKCKHILANSITSIKVIIFNTWIRDFQDLSEFFLKIGVSA